MGSVRDHRDRWLGDRRRLRRRCAGHRARTALPVDAPTPGVVESIWVAAAAGSNRTRDAARALPGLGLEGDRHALSTGTFPTGIPGSALTLVAGEYATHSTRRWHRRAPTQCRHPRHRPQRTGRPRLYDRRRPVPWDASMRAVRRRRALLVQVDPAATRSPRRSPSEISSTRARSGWVMRSRRSSRSRRRPPRPLLRAENIWRVTICERRVESGGSDVRRIRPGRRRAREDELQNEVIILRLTALNELREFGQGALNGPNVRGASLPSDGGCRPRCRRSAFASPCRLRRRRGSRFRR